MEKKVIVLVMLFGALAVAGLVTPCLAAQYTVGAPLGADSHYTVSIEDGDYNNTQVIIYGIVGTVVSLNITNYNGSEFQSQILMDGNVSKQAMNPFLPIYLIAGGLQAGDKITPDGTIVINETITMSWAGATRQVNYAKSANGLFEGWWDQETGIMVKLNTILIIAWFNFTMTDTTAWEPSNLLSTTNLLIAGVGVEFIVIVALAMKLGSHGKPKGKGKK